MWNAITIMAALTLLMTAAALLGILMAMVGKALIGL
jgi:hypothetical protein